MIVMTILIVPHTFDTSNISRLRLVILLFLYLLEPLMMMESHYNSLLPE